MWMVLKFPTDSPQQPPPFPDISWWDWQDSQLLHFHVSIRWIMTCAVSSQLLTRLQARHQTSMKTGSREWWRGIRYLRLRHVIWTRQHLGGTKVWISDLALETAMFALCTKPISQSYVLPVRIGSTDSLRNTADAFFVSLLHKIKQHTTKDCSETMLR